MICGNFIVAIISPIVLLSKRVAIVAFTFHQPDFFGGYNEQIR